MSYMLCSTQSGNSIARFGSEISALEAVQRMVSKRGDMVADMVALAAYSDSSEEEAQTVWSGKELLAKLAPVHV